MNYTQARENMVNGQLAVVGITDKKVLNAFLSVKRDLFFESHLKDLCYSDAELVVLSRKLLTPAALGLVISAAEFTPNDSVLYMGANIGYGCAIIDTMGCLIDAVEYDKKMITILKNNLEKYYSINILSIIPRKKYEVIVLDSSVNIDTINKFIPFLSPKGRIVGICSYGGNTSGYVFCAYKSQDNNKLSIERLFDIYSSQYMEY